MENQSKEEEKHPFDYTVVPLPEDCKFKISPSSISKFFDYPDVWAKEHILGEQVFHGSTSTVLGSIVHGLAERYAKGLPSDRDLVEKYIRQFMFTPDVNAKEIRDNYPDMASLLINDYVRKNKPTEVEQSLCAKVDDESGIYLAGTCDNLTGTMIVDYKTASKKPAGDNISYGYYLQLMAYAYLYRQTKGIIIDRIRLVYVIRPTKEYGPRLHVVTKVITEEHYKEFQTKLKIIIDSIKLYQQRPNLGHICFRSTALLKD